MRYIEDQKYAAIEFSIAMINLSKYECNHSLLHNSNSLNVGKFSWVLNGLQEFVAMLDVMHLLLNFRTKDIAKRSLPQELGRNYPHSLPILFIHPQRF